MRYAQRRAVVGGIAALSITVAGPASSPIEAVAAAAPAPANISEFPAWPGRIGTSTLPGKLITAGPDGNLWFTEGSRIGRMTTDFKLTEFRLPPNANEPERIAAGVDGNLWFATRGNQILRLTPSGEWSVFPTPGAPVLPDITSIVSGPDGNMWFTQPYADRIGRITPSGVITEFPVVPSGEPWGITSGPDGNLWFTANSGNYIGRMTPNGSETVFNLPPPFKDPTDITVGKDGNVWFTELRGIGRITVDGTFTEFPTGWQFLQPLPHSITGGPDGNLWFLGGNSHAISRITPDGSIQGFDLPSSEGGAKTLSVAPGPGADQHLWILEAGHDIGSGYPSLTRVGELDVSGTFIAGLTLLTAQPSQLTAGPDGNFWITEPGLNEVTRLTPAGVPSFAEYPLPTPGSDPAGITVGPDDNLWFAEHGAAKIGRITTGGVLAEFPIAPGSAPSQVIAGPDGNLWFTESNSASIGRISATGSDYKEYPTPTTNSGPRGITLGPKGDLWFTEYDAGKIGRITLAGQITEFLIPSSSNVFPEGITAGPDGAAWFTESANSSVARISAAGVVTPFVLSSGFSTIPRFLTTGSDGNLWVTETVNNQLARVTPGGTVTTYAPPLASSPLGIVPGPDGWIWFAQSGSDQVGRIGWNQVLTRASARQYAFHGSDGQTWTDMDSGNLALTLHPYTNVSVVLSANADLWTANPGFNQDIGININGDVYAWKESGGFAGTFSPNAAFVQTVQTLYAGRTYVVKLQWKTNRPDLSGTIFAGAGLGPVFSPTRLTAQVLPFEISHSSGILDGVTGDQNHLLGSDGSTWVAVAPVLNPHNHPLSRAFTTTSSGVAVVTGNVDLWTATLGLNQDIGIDLDGSIVAWKESGGRSATFSPNAAFVQAVVSIGAGQHSVGMLWKTNRPDPNGLIFAGAGLGPFSPTELTVRFFPTGVSDMVSTHQYRLTDSDGSTWVAIDPTGLATTFTPTHDCNAVLSANADLFTVSPGFNQDIGISVNDAIAAWKESGGFAGTFSPNAAFVQTVYPMAAGTPYRISLEWKTNRADAGGTIMAGAGLGPDFSPTRLTIQCGDDMPVSILL